MAGRQGATAGSSESEKCPLEERTLERVNSATGFTEVLPSIDKKWTKEVDFLCYSPPPVPPSQGDGGARVPRFLSSLDPLWVEGMEMLSEDLQWLLRLEYHRFWSQVVYDESLHRSLDSYLTFAPRPRAWEKLNGGQLPLDVQELVRNVNKRVFMVFLRMSTHKENTKNFMSPDAFGKIIYEHYLFDIPKLFDLCTLYGGSNGPLLGKMVANIFDKQPRYQDDWKAIVGLILEMLSQQALKVQGDMASAGAVRLDRTTSISSSDFSATVLFLADFSASLRSFLEVCPTRCHTLAAEGFIPKAVEFYETAVVKLQERWSQLKSGLENQQCVKMCLRSLKSDFAWLIHQLLQVCFISPKQEDSSGVRSKTSLDDFIAIVSDIASERNFLREYKKCYDLAEDVRTMQKAHPEVPETNFDYVLSAIMDASSASSEPKATSKGKPDTSASHGKSTPSSRGSKPSAKGAELVPVKDGVLQSLISQVKDLLPHLGEGFIEVCLREFDYNPEAVIGRVLEENLPPHIQSLDFALPSSAVDSATPMAPPPLDSKGGEDAWPSLDTRVSVYDNDEFDVFRRPGDVDLSRVHIGKKFDSGGVATILDDKSHLKVTRERYRAYEIETPWDYISEEKAGELEACGDTEAAVSATFPGKMALDLLYDDEYDDTYDSQNVGAPDDATDEQFAVRRLNQKGLYGRRLAGGGAMGVADDDMEEEEAIPSSSLQGSSVSNERARAKEFVKGYFKTGEGRDRAGQPGGGRGKGVWHQQQQQQHQEPKGRGQWQGHAQQRGRGDRRQFGDERGRADKLDWREFGAEKGREEKLEGRQFGGDKRDKQRRQFGDERGRADKLDWREFGDEKGREEKPEERQFRGERRDKQKRHGDERGRADRLDWREFGDERGRGEKPEERQFGGERRDKRERHFGDERDKVEGRPFRREKHDSEDRFEGAETGSSLHKPASTSREMTGGSGQVQGTEQSQRVRGKPRTAGTSTAGTRSGLNRPGEAGAESKADRTEKTDASKTPEGNPRPSEASPRASQAEPRGQHTSSSKTTSAPSQSEKRARQLKDKHKGSRANHNRKAMADKKRRGGMM